MDITYRYALLHLFYKKIKAIAAAIELNEVYGEGTMSVRTVESWFRRFKSGDLSVEDKPRSGRPSQFDEDALAQVVEQDPKTTVRELAIKLQKPVMSVYRHLIAIGKVGLN